MESTPKKKTLRAREARLTIDCSAEQKRKIKMLAAYRDISITELMLGLVEEKYGWCPIDLSHISNAETSASIEASERGEGLKTFESMDELYKELGI